MNGLLKRADGTLVLVASAIIVLVFYPIFLGLFKIWSLMDQAYSHGFLVFAIAIYLCWRQFRLRRFQPNPSYIGLIFTLLTATGIALARVVNVEIVQQMGLVFLFWCTVWSLLGWKAAKYFVFPVGFLYFAIPFWDYTGYALQALTVTVNRLFLSIWGIRFFVEGTYIHLSNIGTIEVATGCSGQRYLEIALTLSALYAYLNYRRAKNWLILLALGLFLGVVTNWIRVFVIIVVAYFSHMQSPLVHNHEFFGWCLFGAMLIPLFWIASRLEASVAPEIPMGVAGSPRSSMQYGFRPLLILTLLAIAIAGPSAFLSRDTKYVYSYKAMNLPSNLGNWHKLGGRLPGWSPVLKGVDQQMRGTYFFKGPLSEAKTQANQLIQVQISVYERQKQGKELIQYGNHLFDPKLWYTAEKQVPVPGVNPFRWMVLSQGLIHDRTLVAYAYYVAGHWVINPVIAKLLQGWGSITGFHIGALVAVSSECGSDDQCQSEKDNVRKLLSTQKKTFEQLLTHLNNAG